VSLTLIQSQVLEALARAETDADFAVHPSRVREALRDRRPRVQSENYVRVILRELASMRVGGIPIVREEHIGRGRRAFRLLNKGRKLAEEISAAYAATLARSARVAEDARQEGV